ncbi:hypothetical protein SDC9_133751 [bioreactor metagenome]|uniref:Methyltransferase type 11 domain-containing protein n=1 Tax=bioreactor metagenome TaxID=1076179 RepID=A0A645DB29_9ZZZZ
MMLYHVPDIDKALVETHRVLKKGGRFYCATLGENGIGSYIRNALGLPKENLCKFTLQNGAEYLKKLFNTVEKKIYDDALAVTDINDLIAYIHTLPWAEKLRSIPEKEMIDVLEERRENGVIFIPKEYGMFSSRIKK